MNEITAFLNSHTEIHNVALIVDHWYTYEAIKTFLKDCCIDSLCIVGNLPEESKLIIDRLLRADRHLDLYHVPDEVSFCDIQDFCGKEGVWALCADLNEPYALLKAAGFNPRYLIANIKEHHISAFKLWEAYREHTEHILIRTNRDGKDPQILDWNKDHDNDIELSVIFPMYNVFAYLDKCIESIIEWKAPYVEYLFVNDGSPDESREVVLKWAGRDSRIKLLDKENGGCASARQFGLERSKGRYVGFIDPDDWIDPQMFLKLLRSAMIGSYDIAYCGYNEYYESTKKTSHVEELLGWPYSDGCTDRRYILDLINYRRVAIWRGIYKREMIEQSNIHFYTDLRRFDDLPFSIETTAMARSIIAVPEYMYYYRLARPGQDVSADDERLYVHFDIFRYLNESVASKHEAYLTDVLQVSKISTHLWAISKIKPEYLEHYVQRAAEDLNTTGEFKRTYKLAKERIGRENAELYRAIVKGDLSKLSEYRKIMNR